MDYIKGMSLSLVIATAILMFCKCKSNSSQPIAINSNETITLHVDHDSNRILKSKDYFNKIRIIPLETRPESLISVITKVLFARDTIIVATGAPQSNVLAFSALDGTFLHSYGQKGKGPGEYRNVQDINYLPETGTVIILDDTKRAFFYTLSGTFQDEKQTPYYPDNIACFQDNSFAMAFVQNNTIHGEYWHLIFCDDKMNETGRAFPYSNNSPFSTRVNSFIQNKDGDCFFLCSLSDTIFQIEPNSIQAKYYIDFGQNSLKSKSIEDVFFYNDNSVDKYFASLIESKSCYNINEFRTIKNCLLFQYSSQGYVYLAIGSALTGEVLGGQKFKFDIGLTLYPFVVGSTKREFIFSLKSYYFLEQCKKSEILRENYRDILLKIGETSNPLLIFVEPNT